MADLRLRAVNTIERMHPSKQKPETIKPGTLFKAADAKQFKELTSGMYPAARPAPSESADDDDGSTEKTLAQMTKAELVSYAEANEIEIDASAKVAEIRKTIEDAENGGDGGEGGEGGGGEGGGDGTELV